MPLGIDATLRYGAGHPARRSRSRTPTCATRRPYNTPLYTGCRRRRSPIPGLASMQAAAHPAKVDYLYFVAQARQAPPLLHGQHRRRSTRTSAAHGYAMIGGETRLVGLIGNPVEHSLLAARCRTPRSPRAGSTGRTCRCPSRKAARGRRPRARGARLRGRERDGAAQGRRRRASCDDASSTRSTRSSSGTAAWRGYSTDAAILDGLDGRAAGDLGAGGAAAAFRAALPGARVFSRRRGLAARGRRRRPRRQRDVRAGRGPRRRRRRGRRSIDLPYPETATGRAAREAGATVVTGLEVLVAQGAASFELWTGMCRARRRHARRRRLARHDARSRHRRRVARPRARRDRQRACRPGSMLDRAAIDADLRRRQQGYGRSPRQQIETDEVEVSPACGTGARSGRRSRSSSATATTRTGRGG